MVSAGFRRPAVFKIAVVQIFLFLLIVFVSVATSIAQAMGGLSGTITDAKTGVPLPDIQVKLYGEKGQNVDSVRTDSSGIYSWINLEPGSYYLVTGNNDGYIDEYYPDHICGHPCYSETSWNSEEVRYAIFAESVTIVADEIVSGIDISLNKGGTISGRLTDKTTGAAIVNEDVIILDAASKIAERITSDDQGRYVSSIGLPSGDYYLETDLDTSHINHRLGAPFCTVNNWCEPGVGTAIEVLAGVTTEVADIEVVQGGVISGYVRDSDTGEPVVNTRLVIRQDGFWFTAVNTDSAGFYLTGRGLPSGSYSVELDSIRDYINRRVCHNSDACNNASLVDVREGATIENVDFFVEKGGQITGKVIDKETGELITGVDISIYNEDGDYVTDGTTNNAGEYLTGSKLESGNYYVSVSSDRGKYLDSCYIDVICVGAEPVSIGKAVSVTKGKITGNINIALKKGGGISGRVTDEETGEPTSNAKIYIYDQNGRNVASAYSDSAGDYETQKGLVAGKYYVKVCNQLYENYYYSSNCEFYGGYPADAYYEDDDKNFQGDSVRLRDKESASGIDFQMTMKSDDSVTVPVTVTDKLTGEPLVNVRVELALPGSGGQYSPHSWADALGRIILRTQPGEYFIYTENTKGYFDTVYENGVCEGSCQGSEFVNTTTLTSSDPIEQINFELEKGGLISGRITDVFSNPLNNESIMILNLEGEFVTSAFTGSNGVYHSRGGLSGDYYMHTQSHFNEVVAEFYSDTPVSEVSALSDVVAVSVAPGEVRDDIDFMLEKGFYITGKVIDDATRLPVEIASIHIFNRYGVFVTSGSNDPETGFGLYSPLSSGEYYLVVLSDDYKGLVYGGGEFDGCQHWLFCQEDMSKFENATLIEVSDRDVSGINIYLRKENQGGGSSVAPFSLIFILLCYISRVRQRNERAQAIQ